MSILDPAALADALVPAVLAAGRIEMKYYREGVVVERKGDQSPVTAADREAETILLQALSRAAPDVPVIAEEAVSAGMVPTIGGRFFLVDPLDGTKEFINKRDEFTVNVALVEGGVPTFGIVYAPALDAFYAGWTNGGAVLAHISPDSQAQTLAACAPTPIRCRRTPSEGLVAMASRSHGSDETEAFLSRYRVAERRNAGSSLKFCVLAEGKADVYPRLAPTCEWDTAAGHAVLLAAGGSVVTLEGRPLSYGNAAAQFLNPSFIAWGGPPLSPQV